MSMIDRFYDFLGRPIQTWSRIALVVLLVPLIASFFFPLWQYSLVAPQYPKGLWFDIYSYTLVAGNDGQHLQEINTLNHYIGMHPINRAQLSDLDWMPFAFGLLALLTMRVAVLGTVRMLIDLLTVSFYIGAFGMGRFAYKLWVYGHNLDPAAPVKVKPFMPVVFGTDQIANFTATSVPQIGTFFVLIFVAGVATITGWHLFRGRKRAVADRAAELRASTCVAS